MQTGKIVDLQYRPSTRRGKAKNLLVELTPENFEIEQVTPSNLPGFLEGFQVVPMSINVQRSGPKTLRLFIKEGDQAYAGPATCFSTGVLLQNLASQTSVKLTCTQAESSRRPGYKPIRYIYGQLLNGPVTEPTFFGDYPEPKLEDLLPSFLIPEVITPAIDQSTPVKTEPLALKSEPVSTKPVLKRVFDSNTDTNSLIQNLEAKAQPVKRRRTKK